MARVTYAPIVDQVRGRFRGVVFSRFRETDVLYPYTRPRDARTAAQLARRAAFGIAMQSYGVAPSAVGESTAGVLSGVDAWRAGWENWAAGVRSARGVNGFAGQFPNLVGNVPQSRRVIYQRENLNFGSTFDVVYSSGELTATLSERTRACSH